MGRRLERHVNWDLVERIIASGPIKKLPIAKTTKHPRDGRDYRADVLSSWRSREGLAVRDVLQVAAARVVAIHPAQPFRQMAARQELRARARDRPVVGASSMTIDIADIKRLNLGPKDVLVVQLDGVMSDQVRKRVHSIFIETVPSLAGRVLVIDRTVTLAVVDSSEATA